MKLAHSFCKTKGKPVSPSHPRTGMQDAGQAVADCVYIFAPTFKGSFLILLFVHSITCINLKHS